MLTHIETYVAGWDEGMEWVVKCLPVTQGQSRAALCTPADKLAMYVILPQHFGGGGLCMQAVLGPSRRSLWLPHCPSCTVMISRGISALSLVD